MIYGVAVLAACTLLGKLIGSLLGMITGTGSDIGGVGFGMILLLVVTNSPRFQKLRTENFTRALTFWQGMFIPIVIAMAASQNVFSALSGGIVAILAGLIPVLAAFLLLPVICRLAGVKKENSEGNEHE